MHIEIVGKPHEKWPFVVFRRQIDDMMDLRTRKKVNETRSGSCIMAGILFIFHLMMLSTAQNGRMVNNECKMMTKEPAMA
jgi:hypothetical protein